MKKFEVNQNDDFHKETPSGTFISSVADTHGSSDTICACGVRHIAFRNCNDADYRDYVESEAVGDENVVIHYDDHFVHLAYLAGRIFVIGCKCNSLKNYENFIWEARDTIRSYLHHRTKLEKTWADHEKVMNTLAGI